MIYTFLQKAIKKRGRPVTTSEIEDLARETLPMCVDHVAHHLVELERKGIVKKNFDIEKKGYVWQPKKEYTIKGLMEEFPELYGHSLYFYTVMEALEKKVDMEEAMQILYEISGGSEKRPNLSEIKRRLEEIKKKYNKQPAN
jgi:predicted transcriptional regulator